MHTDTLQKWQHSHEFVPDNRANEQKTLRVVILTAVMMALVDVLRGWLPLWLPLIGCALLLHGIRSLLPAPRP